jgi:hypothetical protein
MLMKVKYQLPPPEMVEFMSAYVGPYFDEFLFYPRRGDNLTWYAALRTEYLCLAIEFRLVDEQYQLLTGAFYNKKPSITCHVGEQTHYYMDKFPHSEVVLEVDVGNPDGPQEICDLIKRFRRAVSRAMTSPPARGSGVPKELKRAKN